MKVLILGGDGMLGHQLLGAFGAAHEVRATLRRTPGSYSKYGIFNAKNAYGGVDVRVAGRLGKVLHGFRPQVVVNTVALVPQRGDAGDVIANLEVNALFPHRLAKLCREIGARLVHISTDSVFSGERGGYRESDRPDPLDLYGRCKLLGEVTGPGALTLRTAIVGLGLTRRTGLIDWFLQQRGQIKGHRGAIFSGLTVKELSRVIGKLVSSYPHATGLYHVSAAPISKHDLLARLRDLLALPLEIVADDTVRLDRSLDSTRFRADFAYAPPSWEAMLGELAGDIREKTGARAA